MKKLLARKLDILEFIMKRELIWAYELEEKFGYSPKSVPETLYRLKKSRAYNKYDPRLLGTDRGRL